MIKQLLILLMGFTFIIPVWSMSVETERTLNNDEEIVGDYLLDCTHQSRKIDYKVWDAWVDLNSRQLIWVRSYFDETFDNIEQAIEESGIELPPNLETKDTSLYLVRELKKKLNAKI